MVLCVTAIVMFVAVCTPDASDARRVPVSEECLQCICQAQTGCQQNMPCANGMCGMFAITWPYWFEAGYPTVNGNISHIPQVSQNAVYPDCANVPECANCTTDTNCAARAVIAYLDRFQQDCNEDGDVDCYDYIAIHQKGGYGCTGELPSGHVNLFSHCMAAVAAQRL